MQLSYFWKHFSISCVAKNILNWFAKNYLEITCVDKKKYHTASLYIPKGFLCIWRLCFLYLLFGFFFALFVCFVLFQLEDFCFNLFCAILLLLFIFLFSPIRNSNYMDLDLSGVGKDLGDVWGWEPSSQYSIWKIFSINEIKRKKE